MELANKTFWLIHNNIGFILAFIVIIYASREALKTERLIVKGKGIYGSLKHGAEHLGYLIAFIMLGVTILGAGSGILSVNTIAFMYSFSVGALLFHAIRERKGTKDIIGK